MHRSRPLLVLVYSRRAVECGRNKSLLGHIRDPIFLIRSDRSHASQAPDPAHPDELLLVADQPGNLMLHVRVREGLTERRETKSVTAVPDVTSVASPFPLRLFLNGWGLTVIAILVIGFAGALVALGDLTSADFIALVVPMAALLGVIAVARSTNESSPRPGYDRVHGKGYGAGPVGPEP